LLLETGEWDLIPQSINASRTATEWNRDGSAFDFARRSSPEGNAGIFERSVNGDAERLVYRLSEPDAGARSLEFSPDRKWLAFQQETGGSSTLTRRIMVLDVGTGEARTVLEKTTDSTDFNRTLGLASWSPSGDLLVWRYRIAGPPPETLLVPVNGGAPRSVAVPTIAPSALHAVPRPLFAKWSPAGRTIVFVRESRGYETFVIENPLAAMRATTASR
jgi:Tol biopolymer transport system component